MFDLGLVDYMMPGMSGIDLVRQLRSEGATLPLVALTGLSEAETREACLNSGFDAWASKPFTKESLRSIIQRFKPEPIISSLIDQPEMTGIVEVFISGVQSHIQRIEGALATSDIESLSAAIRQVRVHAGTCGFEPIRDLSDQVEKKIAENQSLPDVQSDVIKLARLCRAAIGQTSTDDVPANSVPAAGTAATASGPKSS